MAQPTEAQKAEFKRAFSLFDKNGDGNISSSELSGVMKQLGRNMTEAEVTDMLKEIDSDGSGTIEFNEFTDYMMKKLTKAQQPTNIDEIRRKAFQACDKDGSGTIGPKEFVEIMKQLGDDSITEHQAREMITRVDKDGDCVINYDEFVALLSRK